MRRAGEAAQPSGPTASIRWQAVSNTGDYIFGAFGLLAIAVSVTIAGRTTRRAALPTWKGTPALLADGILALGTLVVVSELLGLFGILEGVILVVACLIVGGGAVRLEPMLIRAGARVAHWGKDEEPEQRPAPEASRLELAAAAVIALVVAAQWAGPTLLALDRGIYGGDSLWYHLPLAAHIAGTGSVTSLLYTDPLYLNWFYPQVSELLHADGILVFGDDFLSPLLNLGWLGLALVAGWCIGRPYGAGATSLAAVASVMAANLLFSRQPGNANNDVVAIALFLAAAAVLLNARWPGAKPEPPEPEPEPEPAPPDPPLIWRPRHGDRPPWQSPYVTVARRPEPPPRPAPRSLDPPFGALLVAGLAAGLALGTKLTVVPPVLALTVGVIWIAGKGFRLRAAGTWIGALVVGGGYWYARNLIVSGNPFPWQDIGPIHHAEALQGRHPYAIVHYATDTDVWGRFFTPGLHERLGDLWPAFLALAVIAVLLVLWRGSRVERMLAAVAALAAVAYLLTPLGASGPEGTPVGFRLNIRYLAPGLVLALTLLAVPPDFVRGRRLRRLGDSERLWRLGTLAIFGVLTVVSGGAIGAIDTGRIPGTVVIALALVAVPLLLVFLSRRGLQPVPLAGIGAAALIALAVGGRFAQDHYLDQRYSSAAPDYPKREQPAVELGQGLGAAYDWARGTRDLQIALSGTMGALFQYGLWGGDSSNDVTYIGQKGPRGSFDEIPECPEWIGALNDGDYDYVVTTPTYHQDDPAADKTPIQRRWISHAGNVKRVAGTGLVDVWRITGPLDPLACTAGLPAATG
jgi:hypothetical protein